MNQLPPECPRCHAQDAKLQSVKDGFLHDPPGQDEKPIATIAVFVCECGHVFTEVEHYQPAVAG